MKTPQPGSRSVLAQEVLRALSDAGLLRRGTRILVAVSGGADSMALLHVLAREARDLTLRALHLDHGIRAESATDAIFVQGHAHELGIQVEVGKVDVPDAARRTGLSLEMQARSLRYSFFRDLYHKWQADAVVTAHTRNDQAETVLLNLCRGSGPEALGGIPGDQVREGMRIVRPLLHVSRLQVLDYLQETHTPWREDPSNADRRYRRNAVRHDILPQLQQSLNPRADEAIAAAAQRAREDHALLQAMAYEQAHAVLPADRPDILLCEPFCVLHPALRRRILVAWLTGRGALPYDRLRADTLARIDNLAATGSAGACIKLGAGCAVHHAYDHLVLCHGADTTPPDTERWPLQLPGTTPIPALHCRIVVEPATGYQQIPAGAIADLPATVSLCKPEQGLWVRTRRPGDRIRMHGAPGSRKLQDIWTDAKVPRHKRDQIPLLVSDDDAIIWFPGGRPAEAWCVAGMDAPALRITILPD